MKPYRLWTLDERGLPLEIRISRNGDLDEQRQYRDNLQQANPKKAYWITEICSEKLVI